MSDSGERRAWNSALVRSLHSAVNSRGGPLRPNRDFHELLECFARHNVRHIVVGGWSLAAHGSADETFRRRFRRLPVGTA